MISKRNVLSFSEDGFVLANSVDSEDGFVLANSVDSDEMLHHFYQGLPSLSV